MKFFKIDEIKKYFKNEEQFLKEYNKRFEDDFFENHAEHKKRLFLIILKKFIYERKKYGYRKRIKINRANDKRKRL